MYLWYSPCHKLFVYLWYSHCHKLFVYLRYSPCYILFVYQWHSPCHKLFVYLWYSPSYILFVYLWYSPCHKLFVYLWYSPCYTVILFLYQWYSPLQYLTICYQHLIQHHTWFSMSGTKITPVIVCQKTTGIFELHFWPILCCISVRDVCHWWSKRCVFYCLQMLHYICHAQGNCLWCQ